jgi:hypothetical protein
MKHSVFKWVFLFLASVVFANAEMETGPSEGQIVDRDSQWDFFKNVIPKQKSITISGRDWTMVIDDKYKVTFSGKISRDLSDNGDALNRQTLKMTNTYTTSGSEETTFHGIGFVAWENERLIINLPINASGRINSTTIYQDERLTEIDRSSENASGNTTIATTFDLQAEYLDGKFSEKMHLSRKTLTLNMTGNRGSSTRELTVGGSNWYTATIVAKSESELNTSATDEFGEWTWNTDRTRLFLKSQNSDTKFVILNNNGTLTWCMEMVKGSKGSSESTTDTGDKLVNLAMAFDGAPAQNFSFVENAGEATDQNLTQLDYAVYNRFLGTLDKNSDTVLDQIKEKQMLILTYTVNGTQRTDMFLLEGLTTILDYLKK